MTILYVLLAILLLGILIMVHEFGHFAVARLCGIAVKEFSLGFGPVIWQHKSKKGDTTFFHPSHSDGWLLHVLRRHGRLPERQHEGRSPQLQ